MINNYLKLVAEVNSCIVVCSVDFGAMVVTISTEALDLSVVAFVEMIFVEEAFSGSVTSDTIALELASVGDTIVVSLSSDVWLVSGLVLLSKYVDKVSYVAVPL